MWTLWINYFLFSFMYEVYPRVGVTFIKYEYTLNHAVYPRIPSKTPLLPVTGWIKYGGTLQHVKKMRSMYVPLRPPQFNHWIPGEPVRTLCKYHVVRDGTSYRCQMKYERETRSDVYRRRCAAFRVTGVCLLSSYGQK